MKAPALILLMLLNIAMRAQQPVQTIVPLQPIAVGTAFQVQYIVTGSDPAIELQSPAFGKNFRYVSGPRLYQGEALINNKKTPIQNFSYTLIPLRKGRLIVKGATVVFDGTKKKSNDAFVIVTDAIKNDPLASTLLSGLPRLAPGARWKDKLAEQIFVKAAVSKRRCFVGEPVVATFTLFSRLPAASEIIKNPGFYGFSVSEIPSAAESGQTVQTHNGTFYNTHVLRHVQLYPAQAGNLVIDKMSVNNAIEYLDSASGAPVQTAVVLESDALLVSVSALPAATNPVFSGAIGRFAINAHLEKGKWKQNANGKLVVTLSGAGNFLQIAEPEIQWPKGVHAYDPVVTERLRKEAVPVAGTRAYSYTFTTDSAGKNTIPPVVFTYFDPALKKYKTTHTDSLTFTVQEEKRKLALPPVLRKRLSGVRVYIVFAAVALLLVAALLFYKRYNTRKAKAIMQTPEDSAPDFEKRIHAISPNDADAYRQLQQVFMGFLKSWDPEVDVSKRTRLEEAAFKKTERSQQVALQAILDECEAVQYYNAAPTIAFEDLKKKALQFMQSVREA